MLNDTNIKKFRASLRGELIQPSDERYNEARKLWNGMFDRRPTLITRCAGTADVVSAVNFGRDESLQVAVRGGSGNFGVVTSFDYQFHAVGPTILGGMVAYPLAKARRCSASTGSSAMRPQMNRPYTPRCLILPMVTPSLPSSVAIAGR
jgi:hypothetical protein